MGNSLFAHLTIVLSSNQPSPSLSETPVGSKIFKASRVVSLINKKDLTSFNYLFSGKLLSTQRKFDSGISQFLICH